MLGTDCGEHASELLLPCNQKNIFHALTTTLGKVVENDAALSWEHYTLRVHHRKKCCA